MRLLPVLGFALLSVTAACDMTMEDVELAGTPAGDQRDCEKLGFEIGTDAMAQCMASAAADRRAMLARLQ